MNNKGFIATSLIYSFFLIFITLFLTIIADYLQNKVLLNTIENGIKDNINTTKGIEDFDVGDIINLSISGQPENGTGIYGMPNSSMWIIANISFDNKDTPDDDESSIVLYNLKAEQDVLEDETTVTVALIKVDLESNGNYNDTLVNELITTSIDNYKLPNSSNVDKISKVCSKAYIESGEIKTRVIGTEDIPDTETLPTECTSEITAEKYRERKEITEWNDKKVSIVSNAEGGFTITGAA